MTIEEFFLPLEANDSNNLVDYVEGNGCQMEWSESAAFTEALRETGKGMSRILYYLAAS